MIHGVVIKPLKTIPDERGSLVEILRNDDPIFETFGMCYLTSAYPGVTKAWHYHKLQDDHFCCVRGMAKVVLYDSRPDSPTRGEINEFFMGERNRILLKIPKLVYHGFKGIGTEEMFMLNFPTKPYNYQQPDEYRVDPHVNDIPYKWAQVDR